MKHLVIAMLLLSVCQLRAQYGVEFMHSAGGKYFFYPNAYGLSATALVYSPRVNLTSTERNSISVGTHFAPGFAFYSGAGRSQRSLALDLPLVGEFNFGHGSTRYNESLIGGYVGAGYAIHRISMAENDVSGSATLHGPVFTGGIRFIFGNIGSYDLGATYMVKIKDNYNTTPFGISVSYIFGMNGGY